MSGRPEVRNSAVVRVPERLVLPGGGWRPIDLAVRYARFRHPVGGHGLVDTGYGERVTGGPRSLALRAYARLLAPRLLPRPDDEVGVRTILLTHLHADHVAALRDHPQARIVAHRGAVDRLLAMSPAAQVRHGVFGELLPDDLRARVIAVEDLPRVEAPLGLGAAGDVFGDGSVLAVPLPGHMLGHTGFLWTGPPRPLLYAADVEWLDRALMQDRHPGPPASWILADTGQTRATARRVAAFVRAGGEAVLCHQPCAPDLEASR